jgi:hypothetical protein
MAMRQKKKITMSAGIMARRGNTDVMRDATEAEILVTCAGGNIRRCIAGLRESRQNKVAIDVTVEE